MSDDGYTLAEMLAALAILGLALGGLGLVVSLIARQQMTATRVQARVSDARAADRALADLMADADPETLNGDAEEFSVSCGEQATCTGSLRLDGARSQLTLKNRSGASRRLRLRAANVRFAYSGARGMHDVWSAASSSEPLEDRASLRAIMVRAGGAPLAVIRIWRGEARDCQYDAISGDCRAAVR